MDSTGPIIKLRPEIELKAIKSKPPVSKNEDPAQATIEALKKQSVVFLNSSVQIFRTGGGTPPVTPSPKVQKPETVPSVKKQFPPVNLRKNASQSDAGDDEVEVGLRFDGMSCSSDEYDDEDGYSNGWDDFGSEDDSCERVIDYICRRCGTTFQSSSRAEYFYCDDCKPHSNDNTPLQQAPVVTPPVQPMQQLHYAKYTCKNCGVQFYSKVGNYNLCEVCSGLHNKPHQGQKKTQAHFLRAAIQRAQQSGASQKHFLESLTPIRAKGGTPGPEGAPNSPFSWGYTRKECKVCGQDFYNRIEDWYYCPKCVANSSSLKSKKKKSNKHKLENIKHEGSEVENNENQSINIKTENNVSDEKKEDTKGDNLGVMTKKGSEESFDGVDTDGLKNSGEEKVKTEIKDSITNGEENHIKKEENHIKKEEKSFSRNTPIIPFKFILYACKLCKKTFYSNLLDCFYCQVCCNANSITRRANKSVDSDNEEERRIKELSGQEIAKEEKYDKYFCKVCGKEFYSSVGEWDFCNRCNSDTNSAHKTKPHKVVSSFTRKNVTFNRYSCNICKNYFFSSREDQDCCKKCTRIVQAMKVQNMSDDEDAGEHKWENVVYAKYICKSCEKPFYSKVGEYYYCSECNPETKFMINNKKMLGCTHCTFETHLKKELRKHLLTLPKDTKRKCACCQCSQTAEPLAEGEEQEAIIYQCKKCEFNTKFKKKYKMHKQLVHKAKVQLYSCKHCKFQSCHKGRLKCHIMTKHEGLKVYQCEQCDYATRQSGRLSMHVAVVHYGETPYPCITCDAKFGTKALLKAHITAEHEPKVIKCQKCDFSTTKKDQFKIHMNNHRDNDVLKCSKCEFATSSANKLLHHLTTMHSEKSAHKCPMCNFRTSQHSRMEAHIVSKHLNNSYKCDKCNFSTPDLMRLKRHSTFSHHRPKKYKKNPIIQHCPYCDYKVKQVKRFTDHLATLHPNEPLIEPVVIKKRRSRNRRSRNQMDLIGQPMIEDAGSQDEQNGTGDESGNYSSDENDNSDEFTGAEDSMALDNTVEAADTSMQQNLDQTSHHEESSQSERHLENNTDNVQNDVEEKTESVDNIQDNNSAVTESGNTLPDGNHSPDDNPSPDNNSTPDKKSKADNNPTPDKTSTPDKKSISDKNSTPDNYPTPDNNSTPGNNPTPDKTSTPDKKSTSDINSIPDNYPTPDNNSTPDSIDESANSTCPNNKNSEDNKPTSTNSIPSSSPRVTTKSTPDKNTSRDYSPSPKRFRYECPDCSFKAQGRKDLRDHVCTH